MAVRLEEITPDNVQAARDIRVKPEQEKFVAPDALRAGIWRLNISASEQGKGYGRFAVDAVAQEARRRGQARITVFWVPGEGGPEGFTCASASVGLARKQVAKSWPN
jgi:diamine N-acetyltransferase